jgi:hypothetical protein
MVLLLIAPTTFATNSVSRMLAGGSEESSPLTLTEEIREEARFETDGWELVDQSSPALQAFLLQNRLSPSPLRRPFSTRAAEHLAQNGCGAVLRC